MKAATGPWPPSVLAAPGGLPACGGGGRGGHDGRVAAHRLTSRRVTGRRVDRVAALRRLVDASYERLLDSNPSLATAQGDRRGDRRWEDLSDRGIEADAALARRELEAARAFRVEALEPRLQLQQRIFVAQQEAAARTPSLAQPPLPAEPRSSGRTSTCRGCSRASP